MNSIIDFSGRFHPVLVHLPIGFLLLAIIFQWLSIKEKYAQLKPAIRISFLLGAAGAVLSCLTGLALSSGGGYDTSILQFHQWFGIAVALCSTVAYLFAARPFGTGQRLFSTGIFVLLLVTGHLGGTLTHGEGFLTQAAAGEAKQGRPPIADVQEALVFADIIQPVLKDKCGSCHSASKQKGDLRLDAAEWISKGGKNGQVFTNGNADGSELYKRIVLDPLEEKHMPPKGKPQLTATEINLLHWWINSQAGFDKKVKEVEQPASISAALQSLQSPQESKTFLPAEAVAKAPDHVLDELRKSGVAISAVAANSNYLQASFVTVPEPGEKLLALLSRISDQLVWLRLPGIRLSAAEWKTIGDCHALTRLSLEHSNISDTTIAVLNDLSRLQYLNLAGTKISVKGVQQLKGLKELGSLYLGRTGIRGNEFSLLKQWFPKTIIDSGNYRVSTLATDTQLLKPPPKK